MSRIATRAAMTPLWPSSERHLGRDVRRRRSVIEGLDQRRVSFGDVAAAELLRARQFVVVRIELLVQDEEAADLRAGDHLFLRRRPVHLLDLLGDDLGRVDCPRARCRTRRRCRSARPSSPPPHVDVDQGAHGVARRERPPRGCWEELELVLDVFRREHGAVGEVAHVIGAVDDLQLAVSGRRSRRRRYAPIRQA